MKKLFLLLVLISLCGCRKDVCDNHKGGVIVDKNKVYLKVVYKKYDWAHGQYELREFYTFPSEFTRFNIGDTIR